MENSPPFMLNVVTLGVTDFARSVRFYEELGLARRLRATGDEIAFFDAGAVVLALFRWDMLAEDAQLPATPRPAAFRGTTLARMCRSDGEVDARRRRERHRDLGAAANLGIQLLAGLGIELFGIIEAARHALGIENDRGRDDRPGERPPAGLVAARDRPDAALERGALAAEGRTDVLLAERKTHDVNGV